MNDIDELTEHYLLTQYLKNKYWVLGSVLVCCLLAFIYLQVIRPTYRMTARAQLTLAGNPSADLISRVTSKLNSSEITQRSFNQIFSPDLAGVLRRDFVVSNEGNPDGKLVLSLLISDTVSGRKLIESVLKFYNQHPITYHKVGQSISPDRVSLLIVEQQLSVLHMLSEKLKKELDHIGLEYQSSLRPRIPEQDDVQEKLYEVFVSYLKHPVSQFSILPYSDEIIDNNLKKDVEAYNKVQNDKQTKLRNVKETSSQIKDLDGVLTELQGKIYTEISLLRARSNKGRPRPAIAGARKIEIKDSIKQTETLIANQIEVRSKLAAQIPIPVSSDIPVMLQFTEKPYADPLPEFPRRGATYLFALALGLIIPALIPLASPKGASLDNKVISSSDAIMKATKIRAYELPSTTDKKNSEIPGRLLADISNELQEQSCPQLWLVTSIENNLSCEYFFRRLADQFSLTNKKAVFVDFNFRDSELSRAFSTYEFPGVVNFLEKTDLKLMELLHFCEDYSNIAILSAGAAFLVEHSPANSFFASNQLASPWADEQKLEVLINSPRVRLLLDELKTKFDYVVIGAPGIGQPADFFPLVTFSDLEIILAKEPKLKNTKWLKHLRDLSQRKRFNHPVIFYMV